MFERERLPRLTDRIPLAATGLHVSPLCLGITGHEDTVIAAYMLGVNFFFLTADLHWPLYEHTRRGLAKLFAWAPHIRETVVVAVTSYLGEPLFRALQLHEVIASVPGLRWVDVMVAGAVSDVPAEWDPRIRSLVQARAEGHVGARAIGASFHSRSHALRVINAGPLEIAFLRYNARHPGARTDVFPLLRPDRSTAIFGFKSTMFHDRSIRPPSVGWEPSVTDHYRFALSTGFIQGVLASPLTPAEVEGIARALELGALTPDEERHMISLASGHAGWALWARPHRGGLET